MKMKLYNFLINRHAGIRSRYHRFHDNSKAIRRLVSYVYLLWLNFCYYVLFCRFLDEPENIPFYEEKELLTLPESEAASRNMLSVEQYVEKLCQHDVVSFDIFDTLLLRPFSEPTDLFYFLGEKLGRLDFKRIRMEQEALARVECHRVSGHYEVAFADIWRRLEQETGLSAESGMRLEQELEMQFCYANPFMKQVFQKVAERGKQIIVVSDMYLSAEFLSRLLEQNGYQGLSKVYVSCEYGGSKGDGRLYSLVRQELLENASVIHVGDNEHSDVKMAEKSGITALHYPNVNRKAGDFRPYDMSPVIGGAYRGIVDNHLYRGGKVYSLEYEYGYIYGGLFALGYCNFIREYCVNHRVDKVLFLSRDGDILKQVYDRLYPGASTAYVCWSRSAATKLMAEYDPYDYFRRYLSHKVNQKVPVREILQAMDLGEYFQVLLKKMPDDLTGDVLTDQNEERLKKCIRDNWQEICAVYREYREAAKLYYQKELEGVQRAVAVDIGWAGSGAMALSHLVEKVWQFPCEITGLIAGTNTVHNSEPDASEIFLQSGKLVPYLFSQSHNRDVMKRHDPGRDYNVFWELLLSSPARQFLGFCFEEALSPQGAVCLGTGIYDNNGKGRMGREVCLKFGREDVNLEGIREIQKGILDFVSEYREHFESFPYMFHVSGRDACAPMVLASGHREKYLKSIAERFALEKGIS